MFGGKEGVNICAQNESQEKLLQSIQVLLHDKRKAGDENESQQVNQF